jgi:hypothetical protein
MIDVKRYLRLKQFGVTSIVKTETGNFSLLFKRFEPETGKELEQPEVQKFTLDSLYKRIDELKKELEGLEIIVKESESFDV